jgi:8-oxo-dGTP pyrophosphatase MutT (NUDIX family)
MKEVSRIGRHRKKFVYRDFRREWDGFLKIVSLDVEGSAHRFEAMVRRPAAVVLPADFARRELYMVEQPRHAKALGETEAGRRALERALAGKEVEPFELDAAEARTFELPAGIVEVQKGETPEDAAVRELREETGLIVEPPALVPVAAYYPSIGGTLEKVHAFIARLPNPPVFAETDGDGQEEIIVWKIGFDEIFDRLRKEGFVSASSNVLFRELKIIELEKRVSSFRNRGEWFNI